MINKELQKTYQTFGISISTYFGDKTQDFRFAVFNRSMLSLSKTNFDGKVFIVDDGSTKTKHLEYVNDLKDERFSIVKKENNSGIGACKNTGIRKILEGGFQRGFLADDDLVYTDGWDKIYLDTMDKTGIQHFCLWVEFLWTKNYGNTVDYNGTQIRKTPHVNGAFLTFTKKMIDEIGYFKKLPYVYGHEHSNFTLRCRQKNYMPFFCDVYNSDKYIQLIPESGPQSSIGGPNELDRNKMSQNHLLAMNLNSYEKCEE